MTVPLQFLTPLSQASESASAATGGGSFTADLAIWAPTVAAVASLTAAVAAWRNVKQQREFYEAGRLPHLVLQALIDLETGSFNVALANTGGGIARQTWFVVIEGERFARATVEPDGMLHPGQSIAWQIAFPSGAGEQGEKVTALAGCFDYTGKRLHVWTAGGTHHERLMDDDETGTASAIVRDVFGIADLTELQRVPAVLRQVRSKGH